MGMLRRWFLVMFVLLPLASSAATVVVAEIQGAISPASADYFQRALSRAEQGGAAMLVLRLDTPGGLDTAMRRIIKGILGARLPVAVFVAPSGTRAASAGTYILYASHIAAMAPGTNLGAATPVHLGLGGQPADKKDKDDARTAPDDAMAAKAMHDAAAYIRGLAQLRGRNAAWGEAAVREAASLSAGEALEKQVIDLVADDVPDLLRRIDGRQIKVGDRLLRLEVREARIVGIEPNWKEGLLTVIADPNIALMLVMIGLYGLLFEFYSPGMVAPGVIGGIGLLLGAYGLAMLPINFVGAALLLFGLGLMIAEAFMPSFGVLGIGGIASFIGGALMLVDAETPGLTVAWEMIVPLALVSALVLAAIVGFALRARRRPPVSGVEAMLGSRVEVLEDLDNEGWVRADGERWRARSAVPLARGTRARIVAVDGLTLVLEPESRA